MKLNQSLKLRKKLAGEIAELKRQIQNKNSYTVGSLNAEKYNVPKMYEKLLEKTEELINLKISINRANLSIQPDIYKLSEYKGLIVMLQELPTREGSHPAGGFRESTDKEFKVQFDEEKTTNLISAFQKQVDTIQENLDNYNYTNDLPEDL